jgi:hypothetical protein
MRTLITSFVALALCASASARADRDHDRDRGRDHHAERYRRPRPAYTRTPVRVYRFDPRAQIHADPRFHVAIRGYHPHHRWVRYHWPRARWFTTWGVRSWNDVSIITCEAIDRDTGRRYPISADRRTLGWSDAAVNTMVDQALDECYADGGGAACVPVTPPCMISR